MRQKHPSPNEQEQAIEFDRKSIVAMIILKKVAPSTCYAWRGRHALLYCCY
jgi:hypothetical protein